ncbi:MAG: exodeoxyribonuclease VII large subunit [Chloroflexi bacterium]|nr:exodeoxyribonuclease VII large subunit [Chloroflexota bacterium]
MNTMFQSMLFTNEPWSVSSLTAHVKALLEDDADLADIRVSGEIGNVSRPASGHLYFTLKDAGAQVKCVMWKSAAIRMRYSPRSGDAVIARGHVSVYERDGAYQLYVDSIVQDGTGDLFAEFERLKQALDGEGLFAQERKRPLPPFPRVLGVVTSPTGAAFQDILNVLGRRCAMVQVILAPALVQGDGAPEQIVRGIQALNDCGECDVILVARGGGSLEELWAFNDERVVRAVVASRVPVVSGVGHEIDFTLTDFAADVRAPTPSAAVEMITPDVEELRQNLDALSARLGQCVLDQIDAARAQLESLRRALRMVSPLNQILRARDRVGEWQMRMDTALLARLDLQREQVRGLHGRLEAMSPLATLSRGYAIVRRKQDGAVVRSVNDVRGGDGLIIRVPDGEFDARVTT